MTGWVHRLVGMPSAALPGRFQRQITLHVIYTTTCVSLAPKELQVAHMAIGCCWWRWADHRGRQSVREAVVIDSFDDIEAFTGIDSLKQAFYCEFYHTQEEGINGWVMVLVLDLNGFSCVAGWSFIGFNTWRGRRRDKQRDQAERIETAPIYYIP